MKNVWKLCVVLMLVGGLVACEEKEEAAEAEGAGAAAEGEQPADPEIKADKGVDLSKKLITVGALNDQSGAAAAIGKPFALGKEIFYKQANASGEFLPEGWTVELVNKDHGYNPQKAVQAYKEIAPDVLFIATSFGTPPTLPLRPMLEKDKVVAFPASLSSQMAEHEFTPPLAPTYKMEAMRAADWMVEDAGGADEAKIGIVYQKDDYGKDAIEGLKAAAEERGFEIVAEQTVAPGQNEVTAVIKALQDAGATHVLLGTLPSTTGPLLGTALKSGYTDVKWVGITPAWADAFFNPETIPPQVLSNFYWSTSLPYWGEDVEGMDDFEKAFEEYGGEASRDFYILVSYIQGRIQAEIFKRAIENKDVTREGFVKAMHDVTDFSAGGMIQPVNLSKVPYVVGTQVRVLQPKLEEKSWEVIGDYATPAAYSDGGTEPAEEAPAAE